MMRSTPGERMARQMAQAVRDSNGQLYNRTLLLPEGEG